MEDEVISTRYPSASVVSQPWGPTLSKELLSLIYLPLDILPWNFPIWLPFKIGLPALIAGNPILLKHSPSTPQCSQTLEEIFIDA